MQGLFDREINLTGADLPTVCRVIEEMQRELRFRFSALSKENFGDQDLKELGDAILGKNSSITVKDGKISIEAEEIELTGDVKINGSLV